VWGMASRLNRRSDQPRVKPSAATATRDNVRDKAAAARATTHRFLSSSAWATRPTCARRSAVKNSRREDFFRPKVVGEGALGGLRLSNDVAHAGPDIALPENIT